MKRLLIALTVLFAFSSSALAQMGNGQGGGMMSGDSWSSRWGMGYGFGSGWILMIIIAILLIFGIVYMMKRK
jgi:hypothetical protein